MSILVVETKPRIVTMGADSIVSYNDNLAYATTQTFTEHKIMSFPEIELLVGFVGDYSIGTALRLHLELDGRNYFSTRKHWDRPYSNKHKLIAFWRDFLSAASSMNPPIEWDGHTVVVMSWRDTTIVCINQCVQELRENTQFMIGGPAEKYTHLLNADHNVEAIVNAVIDGSNDCCHPVLWSTKVYSERSDEYHFHSNHPELEVKIL